MYTAVVLLPRDQARLFREFDELFRSHLQPGGFVDRNEAGDRLAHHMTMNMGLCRVRTLLGTEVSLTLDAWAADERACAVRVSDTGGVYCDNETPHVTLFVNPRKGGTPRHSNGLLSWVPLGRPIVVTGTVSEVQR